MISARWQGIGWIALSAIGFGAMAIFAKIAYREGVSLTTLLFLRFALAGLLLAAWGTFRGMRWPRGRDLAGLLFLGGVLYVGHSFAYFAALHYASAGLVAMLVYLYPAIVVVLSAIIVRRRIGVARSWAVGIAVTGTALAVGGDSTGALPGILLGIACALIYSVYVLAGEKIMPRVGPLAASTVVMLAAGAVYGLMVLGLGMHLPDTTTGWAVILAITLFSTLMAILCFFKGLEKLGAADASALSTLEPLVTLGLAALILDETLEGMQMVGGALILAAVIGLARLPTMRSTS